jgi:hypothetical protein
MYILVQLPGTHRFDPLTTNPPKKKKRKVISKKVSKRWDPLLDALISDLFEFSRSDP